MKYSIIGLITAEERIERVKDKDYKRDLKDDLASIRLLETKIGMKKYKSVRYWLSIAFSECQERLHEELEGILKEQGGIQ